MMGIIDHKRDIIMQDEKDRLLALIKEKDEYAIGALKP